MTANPAFEGKVAVVTGAARGIGEAIAVALRDEGAIVFSVDLGEPETPHRRRPLPRAATSPTAQSVAAAFAAVDREAGRVDVLVNNAGIQRVALAQKMSHADWHSVLNTHLTGMFFCAAEAIKRMRPHRKGAIVSIASVAGIVGIPGRGPYSAAKAGIMSLTRVLALENATANIRVNAVAPGFARTKFIEQALKDGSLRVRLAARARADEAPRRTERDRRRRALSRQRPGELRHRPDPGGRRRLDGAGHQPRPRLARRRPERSVKDAGENERLRIRHCSTR